MSTVYKPRNRMGQALARQRSHLQEERTLLWGWGFGLHKTKCISLCGDKEGYTPRSGLGLHLGVGSGGLLWPTGVH